MPSMSHKLKENNTTDVTQISKENIHKNQSSIFEYFFT